MVLVSVIMPVYNGEKYLAEAIESILAQTFTDLELLVVDDASQDSSLEIIRAYQECDSRIRSFHLEQNVGVSGVRNWGIVEARGDYITMMDCDDISLPERLEKQVGYLRANPEIDLVGICGRAVDEDLQPLFEVNLPQQHSLIVLDIFIGVGLIFSTVLMRRELLGAAGGYEPGRRTGEERELVLRLLSDSKVKLANLSDQLLIYRRHDVSLSHDQDISLRTQRREVYIRILQTLWREAPETTLDRFQQMRTGQKLNWRERRRAEVDIRRLIEALIARGLVESRDRPVMLRAMKRKIESTSPRLWQQFCHWRRHRFPRLFPDSFQLYR